MPLYVADYLGDTGHLTTLEHGAYLLLIMHYWQKGELPADDAKLARIAKMTQPQWVKSRDTLADLFQPGWKHKRIDREMHDATEAYERRARAGSLGGRAKRGLHSASALPEQSESNAPAMQKQSQSPLREEGSEAIASGAEAPVLDPTERLWAEGVPHLTAMGAKDRDARSNIGRWIREKHDPEAILGAICRARDHGTRDPVPLVGRLLKPLGKTNGKPQNSIARGFAELRQDLGLDEAGGDSVGGGASGIPHGPVQRLPGRC